MHHSTLHATHLRLHLLSASSPNLLLGRLSSVSDFVPGRPRQSLRRGRREPTSPQGSGFQKSNRLLRRFGMNLPPPTLWRGSDFLVGRGKFA